MTKNGHYPQISRIMSFFSLKKQVCDVVSDLKICYNDIDIYIKKGGNAVLDIAILDDEQIYLEATASMIKEYRDAHSELDISLHIFTSPYDLLGSVDTFDMYLLDVVMPNMTGIEVATVLREKRVESPIVFLTSTREFAVESYSVGAFNYLIKPIDKKKLFEVLDKAFDEVGVKRASFISAKTADGVELVPFNKIVYIEFLDRRVCYHMTNGDLILCNQQRVSFSESIQPILNDPRFCRCGASYVLNLHYVKAVKKNAIQFSVLDIELHLPKKSYSEVLTAWLDYWMEVDK